MEKSVPSVFTLLKKHIRLEHGGIVDHSVDFATVKKKKKKKQKKMTEEEEKEKQEEKKKKESNL